MTVTSLCIKVAGAIRDLTVEFKPGMNVILGANESGKSTLLAFLRLLLFVSSKPGKRQFGADITPLIPRPDGNTIFGSLEFDQDGTYRLEKRWGPEPAESLVIPDGSILHGNDSVGEHLRQVFPVTAPTFDSLLIIGQSELASTFNDLAGDQFATDEAADALRRTRVETGGVSADRFRRLQDERIKTHFDHWDRDTDQPQDGKGADNPWKRNVGDLLEAFYHLQQVESQLNHAAGAEADLEIADTAYAQAQSHLQEAEGFLGDQAEIYSGLTAQADRHQQVQLANDKLDRLRRDYQRWLMLTDELASLTTAQAKSASQVAELETGLAGSRDEVNRAKQRLVYLTAKDVRNRLVAAQGELSQMPVVSPDDLSALASLDHRIADVQAELRLGSLTARVIGPVSTIVTSQADLEQPTETTLGSTPAVVEAHRHLVITAGDIEVQVESGEGPSVEDLGKQRDELQSRREELLARCGVTTREEAKSAVDQREGLTRECRSLESELSLHLGETPFEVLSQEFADEARQDTLDPVGEAEDKRQMLNRSLSDAREKEIELGARLKALQAESDRLVDAYATLDALEQELSEARLVVDGLAEGDADTGPPDGFESVEAFLAEYRERSDSVGELRQIVRETRDRQIGLRAAVPDTSAEELQGVLEEARGTYQNLRQTGEALIRLKSYSDEALVQVDQGTFTPYLERVAGYLSTVTGDRYQAAGESLLPGQYAQSDGPVLTPELLSQGTRDSVALAIRLALAHTVLDHTIVPVLLDDPLVDMDPVRRTLAARAITEFAKDRQVILLTCHPDHAALFDQAHQSNLS